MEQPAPPETKKPRSRRIYVYWGVALASALRVAETLSEGVVVTVFPDGAAKYLSEPFWAAEG